MQSSMVLFHQSFCMCVRVRMRARWKACGCMRVCMHVSTVLLQLPSNAPEGFLCYTQVSEWCQASQCCHWAAIAV